MTVALGLALAALGTVLLGVLALPHPPDLFYLPVAAVARRGRSVPAMLTAFAAGLAEDALATPGRLWGLHSFTKVLVAYLLAAIGARALVEKPVLLGLLVWGAVVVDGFVATLLLWILRGEPLQVRRAHARRTVQARVAIADVVRQDEDDVRRALLQSQSLPRNKRSGRRPGGCTEKTPSVHGWRAVYPNRGPSGGRAPLRTYNEDSELKAYSHASIHR